MGPAEAEFPLRHQDSLLAVAQFYDRDVTERCRQQNCYIANERALKLTEGPHYANTGACHKNQQSPMPLSLSRAWREKNCEIWVLFSCFDRSPALSGFREPSGSREPFQGNLQSHQGCSLCPCVLSSVNPSDYSWAFGSVVGGEGLIAFYPPWMEMGSLPGRAPRDPEVFLRKPSLGSSLAFGNLYWKSGPVTGSLTSPLF